MAEKKTIELEVKTDSVKSLKTQLREAQQEVQTLSEKFGATSREATEAAKKAAHLKDAIGDAKALTDAFNPDAKFNALGGALQGVAGGFSAVQGAMGLFGVESKDVEKTLLKVQSAMAVSEGINSIMGAKDAFTNLAAVIGRTTIGQKLLTAAQVVGAAAMRVLNMVMNANPVLLLVTGITALVGAFYALTRSTDKEALAQKELNRQHELSIKLMKQTQDEVDKYISSLTRSTKNKIDLRKAEGASAEELYQLEKERLEEQIRYTKLMHDSGAKLTAKQYEDQKQAKWDLKILEAQHNADIKALNEKNAEENNNKLKESKDKQQKIYDDEVERRKQNILDIEDLETQLLISKNSKIEQEKQAREKLFEDNIKRAQDETKKMVEINEQDFTNKKNHQERLQRLRQQDLTLASDGFKAIGDFTELMGKRTDKERRRAFKIKKAADLASATIDGTKAVLSTYADTPGGPIIKGVAAGIAGVFSAIQIAKISKQQFDGGGSMTNSNINIPSGGGSNTSTTQSVIAPKFNIGGNSTNQLNTLQQQPIQAYVVSGEVTSAQALDRNKIKNATF